TALALKAQEAKYADIIAAIPDFIFILDRYGIIRYYHSNQGDESFFVPPDEFMGKPVTETLPEPTGRLILDAIRTALAEDRIVSVEYSLPGRFDQQYFEARIVRQSADQVLSLVRNITAEKTAVIQAAEGERHMAAMLNALTDR